MGYIDFSHDLRSESEEIEFSSWEDEEVCPYCGEKHDLFTHNQLNWEEEYPNHNLLKKNYHLLTTNNSNLINKREKFEVIKYGKDINDDLPGYNLVALQVKSLEDLPIHTVGLQYPEKEYLMIETTMGEYMSSHEEENRLFNDFTLEDYVIIKYNLEEREKFNDLNIVVYYPIKE